MTGDALRKTALAAIVLLLMLPQLPRLWCRFTYHRPVVMAGGLACIRCHHRFPVRRSDW